MTHWCSFHELIFKLVFSYNPKIPILGAQNNSSETTETIEKPYINRFPVITAQKHTETIENGPKTFPVITAIKIGFYDRL